MKTIVCVDDNDINLFILQDMLQDAAYNVQAFESANDALNWILEHKEQCGLLLTDIHMPGMNGIELMQKIKSAGVNCPMVAMSGDEEAELMKAAVKAGMHSFISKPYKQVAMLNIVKELLS